MADLGSMLDEIAQAHGLDPGMFRRYVQIESGNNPNARTGSYHGLLQLSQEEFSRFGGGNIYDPRSNATAGAQLLRERANQFRSSHGREPTATDLYLLHQQGVAGYGAHMRNPGGIAWQNVRPYYTDAEARRRGFRSGDEYAQVAIWGNIPRQYRDRFQNVHQVTSQDFQDIWQNRVEGPGRRSTPTATNTVPFTVQGAPLGSGGGTNVVDTTQPIPQQPQAPVQEAPQGVAPDVRTQPEQNTWSSWLQNPSNRAFLIQMGVQLMTPSWGGPMAQLASGVGAGAQASARTDQAENERLFGVAQLASREREGELNRQTQRDIAREGRQGRMDVATIRAQTILERARMIGLRNQNEINQFDHNVRSFFNTLMQNNPSAMSDPVLQDQLFRQAVRQAEETMRSRRGQQPGGDTEAPQVMSGPTQQPGPGGQRPGPRGRQQPTTSTQPLQQTPPSGTIPGVEVGEYGGVGTAPVGGVPTPTAPTTPQAPVGPTPTPQPTPPLSDGPAPPGPVDLNSLTDERGRFRTFEDFLSIGARAQTLLRNPTTRNTFLREHPHLARDVQNWLNANGVQ